MNTHYYSYRYISFYILNFKLGAMDFNWNKFLQEER